MSSPGGAGNVGKSPPGGAQGHTPGSGKKKNRKKNSPRQKTDSEQSKIVKSPPSEKVGSVKTADVMSQGAPHVQDSTLKSNVSANSDTHKIDFLAQLKAQSAEGLPEKSKMKKMDSETEQVKSTAKSEQSQGQKKGKGQGPKSSENKGHKSEDQSLPNAGEPNQKKTKGQGQKTDKGQGQVKVEEQGHKKVEGQSSSGDPGGKSKAELKAERRAKQEAQRAAKEKKKTEGGANAAPAKKEVPRVPDSMKADVEGMRKKIVRKLEKQQVPVRTVVQRKVRLFNHLHQYEREVSITQSLSFSSGGIHPAIVKLGLQYAEGIITGSNARCIGLLAAFKKVISDYTTPPHKELSRDLEARIKPYISFLTQCRPLAVSMGNAIKYLKWQITNIPGDMSDMRAKEILLGSIDSYWEEKIKLAGVAISETTSFKIADGDVIVVYACSSLLRKVLCDAHGSGKKFRVIVVDGRPRLEGKEMLRRLVKAGIKCSYVLIGAASYIMKEATKVLLGAHALLANGFVMSRVGSSMIALIAKSFNVPVLVCCETYKFCKRVQTDSFVCNELGDPDDLVDIGKTDPYLMDWRDYQSLSLLNLVYDVTPPEFISMVITEIGMIPCTSVPVVLRVKHLETNEM